MNLNNWTKSVIADVPTFCSWLQHKAIIAVDTETTGLHIIKDNPFIITLALIQNGERHAFTYEIDKHTKADTNRLIDTLYTKTEEGLLIGHNLIFDLHMLMNIHTVVPHNSLLDTMTLIRLGTDAVPTDRGGAPLALKAFTAQYIDPNAKAYERTIMLEKSAIAKSYNLKLYSEVQNKTEFQNLLNRFPEDIDDLPQPYYKIYSEWINSLPKQIAYNMTSNVLTHNDIPYTYVTRENLLKYAVYDAIYTYEIYEKLLPVVINRHQQKTLTLEQNLIIPFLHMTRTGFKINQSYVLEARNRLKLYIKEQQVNLMIYAGCKVTANQNAVIKSLIQNKFGHPEITKTDEPTLTKLLSTLKEEEATLKNLLETILELRTLAGWYTKYLRRFYNAMQKEDYIYTSVISAGAVTGRISSDFQQFPKTGVKSYKGETLFTPRKMVETPPGSYMVYIDYSQIELRIQAMYTILLNVPDKNLCRAYMPYKCVHYRTGVEFDYLDKTHMQNWNRKQPNSEDSVWLLMEDNSPWTPTDLHSKTTHEAYPDIDISSKEFKRLRSDVGKPANFACNYGAKANRIKEMFHNITMDEATRIYNAYVKTFPGVVNYQKYCYNLLSAQSWGDNLYGRRYYNTTGHNYANAAIQGTGADLLKNKMIELHNFLDNGNYKTRVQMNIHDEISFIVPTDEVYIIPKLKEIMEQIENALVPIVAEIEISQTTWADKKGFNLDEYTITNYSY
jgi:DNA polymerase-1